MSLALSIGARHHHERYDGKGYPDNLKGENIPQIARIIAVADAYDAMTSKRSYRDMIPQMHVREELVKGIGTQFDPEYAKIMILLLDLDAEYQMREKRREDVFEADSSYQFGEYKSIVSAGFRITDCTLTIHYDGETIDTRVENSGLSIMNQTKLPEKGKKVYFYFTGDQCAITNICVSNQESVK